MNESTEPTPLQTIEAFEAAAFRAAQLGRALLAEHPDLPVGSMRLSLYAHPNSMTANVEIAVWDTPAVTAWADALGTTAGVSFHDSPEDAGAFEYHSARTVRGDVEVSVSGTRQPTAEELAVWRAAKAETADAGGTR